MKKIKKMLISSVLLLLTITSLSSQVLAGDLDDPYARKCVNPTYTNILSNYTNSR